MTTRTARTDKRSVLFECQSLQHYPFAQPGFSGGTETYVRRIIRGLSGRGYRVHVVAHDLKSDEQRAPGEWWWPPTYHPTRADVIVATDPRLLDGYSSQNFVLMSNGTDPWLGDAGEWGGRFARVACFSQSHIDLLTKNRPTVTAEQCVITGLGADRIIRDTIIVPGRLLFANDPTRGLWHVLSIFDALRRQVPDATLHVAYDFDQQFEAHRWRSSAVAERMWECQARIAEGSGVVNLGALTVAQLAKEQMACQVHVMPSDPQNVGSQIHGLTQLELAAAGVPLVLSPIEAFPELFGGCATFLPVPGSLQMYDDNAAELRRVTADDWADEVVRLMTDATYYEKQSGASLRVARRHTWGRVLDRWIKMIEGMQYD